MPLDVGEVRVEPTGPLEPLGSLGVAPFFHGIEPESIPPLGRLRISLELGPPQRRCGFLVAPLGGDRRHQRRRLRPVGMTGHDPGGEGLRFPCQAGVALRYRGCRRGKPSGPARLGRRAAKCGRSGAAACRGDKQARQRSGGSDHGERKPRTGPGWCLALPSAVGARRAVPRRTVTGPVAVCRHDNAPAAVSGAVP